MFGEYAGMLSGLTSFLGAPLLIGLGIFIGLAIGVPLGKWWQTWA